MPRRSLTAAGLTLILSACQRTPEWYPVPEQRAPIEGDAVARASMMLEMNDPDAPRHLVKDIGVLEGDSWRWTRKRPTVKLLLVKTQGLKLVVDFTIVGACFEQTGPVSVSFYVGDRLLDTVRYNSPGFKKFEKPVPSAWLQTSADTIVAAEIDKTFLTTDNNHLGFILSDIGFARL